MTRHLHGFHDPGGEDLHSNKPGWTLITEEVGLNPQAPGRDYRHIANRGIGVIVRLNHAYSTGGTIPLPNRYPEFAAACASWAARSQGVDYYIVGNEPNHEGERPNGIVITPEDYAYCFGLCRIAIKQADPSARVMHAAMAPYHANPTNWLTYLKTVLTLLGPQGCDGINIHAYTRSMDPAQITSRATMGPPLQDQYSGFYTYRDVLTQAVPLGMTNLPAFITEFDVYGPWLDQNTGVIQAMYADIDAWNNTRGTQKIMAAICFRWLGPPEVQNQHDWEMRNKPQLLNDFRAAVDRGYQSPPIAPPKSDEKSTTHLPAVSGEPSGPPPKPQPARDLDPRLVQRGVTIETPALSPGDSYWRVKSARWYDEQRSQGRHHIYVEALTEDGRVVAGAPFEVTWPGKHKTERTKAGRGFEAGNYPMSPSRNEFSVRMAGEVPSETVRGIGMGADTPGGYNAGAHTSTLVTFELTSVPQAQPTEPTPTPVPILAHPIADPARRIISQRFADNPADYARFGLAGHTGLDFAVPEGTQVGAVDGGQVIETGTGADGYGIYAKLRHAWGESLYAHLSRLRVEQGELVNKGQLIGLSGNSGNSTGPHLHFAIRRFPYQRGGDFDGFSDPLPYLINSGPPTQPQPAPPPADLLGLIKAAATEFGLQWQLLVSLAWGESSWRPEQAGGGLFQIGDAAWSDWADEVGATDRYNARDNARVAAIYFRSLLRRYGGNERKALWAWNWGPDRVDAGGTPPPLTQEHANKVLMGRDLLKAVGA